MEHKPNIFLFTTELNSNLTIGSDGAYGIIVPGAVSDIVFPRGVNVSGVLNPGIFSPGVVFSPINVSIKLGTSSDVIFSN